MWKKFVEFYNELWDYELFQVIAGIILMLLLAIITAYIPKCNQEIDELIYTILNFIGLKE